MSSSFGTALRVSIFGQSHSPAIGVTVDGLPAGIALDMDALNAFLARRAPGQNEWSTPRREADTPEFLSGLRENVTCGAPLCAVIRNTNVKSEDYDGVALKPRPGHADFTAEMKYGGFQDRAGGGHFSGRLTAPLCIAGGVCLQILRTMGITIRARIVSIGPERDDTPFLAPVDPAGFPAADPDAAERMKAVIARARAEGDSVGGVIECVADGLPEGIGGPLFGGMESHIAAIVFAVPAVKGVEFGAGFASAGLRGSENNDPFVLRDGRIVTETNRCGGILGGITDGMPLTFRAAVKPTPSIAKPQRTIDMERVAPVEIAVTGRHDPCIVPRAVPVMEAAAAIAIYDAILSDPRR